MKGDRGDRTSDRLILIIVIARGARMKVIAESK